MATNPRIPEHRDVPTLVEQRKKRSSASGVIWGIIVAAVILGTIIYFLPRAPRRPVAPANATTPAQPTGNTVQLTNVKLSTAPVGGQMYIYARLYNNGNTSINGVAANVSFPGNKGQSVASFTSAVESYKDQTALPLTEAPIKPNEARDVRIPIEHVPAGWNHEMPGITIQNVTSIGK